MRPERAKAFDISIQSMGRRLKHNVDTLLPFQGVIRVYSLFPGRCPGLCARCPFRATWLIVGYHSKWRMNRFFFQGLATFFPRPCDFFSKALQFFFQGLAIFLRAPCNFPPSALRFSSERPAILPRAPCDFTRNGAREKKKRPACVFLRPTLPENPEEIRILVVHNRQTHS